MPRGGGGTGLSNLMSSKVMPVVLFILAIFLLPFLFTLINSVPDYYLITSASGISVGPSVPAGASGINLKIIAVLILFLLPVFFIVTIVDRFSKRV